eukprot:4175019-Pleurochrysis_carterae.AAC.3
MERRRPAGTKLWRRRLSPGRQIAGAPRWEEVLEGGGGGRRREDLRQVQFARVRQCCAKLAVREDEVSERESVLGVGGVAEGRKGSAAKRCQLVQGGGEDVDLIYVDCGVSYSARMLFESENAGGRIPQVTLRIVVDRASASVVCLAVGEVRQKVRHAQPQLGEYRGAAAQFGGVRDQEANGDYRRAAKGGVEGVELILCDRRVQQAQLAL